MKAMMHVAWLSLLKTRKEKWVLLIMMGLALLFASVFGTVFGAGGGRGLPKIPVGIADYDNTPLTGATASELASSGAYSVTKLTEDQLRRDIREGRLEVGYVFPEGFQESLGGSTPLPVQALSLSTSKLAMTVGSLVEKVVADYILSEAVSSVTEETAHSLGLDQVIDPRGVAAEALSDLKDRPVLSVAYEPVVMRIVEDGGDDAGESRSYLSMGIYLMFTMFTVIFQAGDILEERQEGTWARLLTTPVSRASILGGKNLGAYIIGLGQVAVLFLAGRFLFGVDYGPSPILVAAILMMFLLCVTGLGILLSTVVRTSVQLQALSPIVITATCMLGGCYWPLEIVSPTMRTISKFTPQAWAMGALNDVVARGAGLSSIYLPLLVLAGFTLVFFGLGVTRTKFE